jgi:hypothetical protein
MPILLLPHPNPTQVRIPNNDYQPIYTTNPLHPQTIATWSLNFEVTIYHLTICRNSKPGLGCIDGERLRRRVKAHRQPSCTSLVVRESLIWPRIRLLILFGLHTHHLDASRTNMSARGTQTTKITPLYQWHFSKNVSLRSLLMFSSRNPSVSAAAFSACKSRFIIKRLRINLVREWLYTDLQQTYELFYKLRSNLYSSHSLAYSYRFLEAMKILPKGSDGTCTLKNSLTCRHVFLSKYCQQECRNLHP